MSDPLITPWTVACQASLSMGFPRKEYWRGLPFPSPGDFPDLEIEPRSPVSPALVGGFSTTEPQFAKSFSAPITYLDYYIFLSVSMMNYVRFSNF